MTKTAQLLAQLSEHIQCLPIAGYLQEEALASLKYLHRYKLKNIEKNWKLFSEYLLFLNTQNTDKIQQLWTSKAQSSKQFQHDLDYFLVTPKTLNKKEQQHYQKKISEHGYELLTLIQGIKGILVLSIDEFCNASATRMGIHELLMSKKGEKSD